MIKQLLERQREFFQSGTTKDISFRIRQLKLLKQVIENNEGAILEALKLDLSKPQFEAYTSEILVTIAEIKYALKQIKSWTKPQKVPVSLSQLPASNYIYPEPLGVILIIGPWNYPFGLMITPLVSAIAAGNCAILKPSEISSHTSQIIAKIIGENFNSEFIAVVEGGIKTNQSLLTEKFDHIFFTGSTAIGRIVMTAAAKHLTPVTLELGGKSPCIVDAEVDIEIAARRIVWGKFFNAGQTCVAPDYVLVHRSIKSNLITAMRKSLVEFYGENPETSKDYGRIINEKQFNRLANLLHEGKIVIGGKFNLEERYIAPTVIDKVTWQHQIMESEIFGPILPILEYENLNEAIATINSKPKPLALYFFSKNKHNQNQVLESTSFGGGCINDTIMHLSTPTLPFGGIGESGMGSYHGKSGFDTFSHKKSILKNSFLFDLPLRYPPYKPNLSFLKWLV